MPFDLLARAAALQSANLTIREQTRLAENPLDLRWRAIAPRVEAPSIKLSDITRVDFRPVAARREWNAKPKELGDKIGPVREFEMVPIAAKHTFGERELELLNTRFGNVRDLVEAQIVKDVDGWATFLADAVDRQIEAEFFEAWNTNTITVYDPHQAQSVTVGAGVDAARYVTAGTAWDAAGFDAWDALLREIEEAIRLNGSIGAIRTRRAVLKAIMADAPTGPNGIRPTLANIQERLSEEGFGEITLIADERTYDAPTAGGGQGTAVTNYVRAGRLLFQPANGVVGASHFAPVTRAAQYVGGGERRVNLQDVVVFHRATNEGQNLVVEAQANVLTLPDAARTYVVNTLVTG